MPAAHTAVMGCARRAHAYLVDAASGLTTPTPPNLHRCLRRLKVRGVVVLIDSHALKLQRLHGLTFAGRV